MESTRCLLPTVSAVSSSSSSRESSFLVFVVFTCESFGMYAIGHQLVFESRDCSLIFFVDDEKKKKNLLSCTAVIHQVLLALSSSS